MDRDQALDESSAIQKEKAQMSAALEAAQTQLEKILEVKGNLED